MYAPNTALTNHALSFVHGFDEFDVHAEWVFLLPDNQSSIVNEVFNNVKITYLWNKFFCKNKVLKHLYKHIRYAKFFFSLKEGDVVLLLGASSYLHFLVRRNGIKVFHERTEHPLAVQASKHEYFNKHYIDDCGKTDGLFVISNALKEYFAGMGVMEDKIHVINMVVDAKRFTNIKKDLYVEPYIAYCGKASNSKDGVDDLIRAFAIVAKQIPDIKLYVIGDPSPNESDNHNLVDELGLRKRIIFTGVVPASQMPQILVNAKMLALCRPNNLQNKYGFPTKLGEYLLTGNPVVITRVGDIPLFLEDHKSALMSECHDVETFADNIIWVLEHPNEARAIGLRGKKIAENNFNYLVETKKMYNIMFLNPS